ncbi:MAG: fumarylacetoacetase [Saprospiraceae bacterium]|nr:fumarylacetoacetase [Saprospiraceae bacterium]
MKSWLEIDKTSDFSIYNIPFGVASIQDEKLIVSRIGNFVIVLDILQDAGVFNDLDLPYGIFIQDSLNGFIGLGKKVTGKIRKTIQTFFSDADFAGQFALDRDSYLLDANMVRMALPVSVGDYTDFYSSKEHAFNVGCMFRGPENALMPNWTHLPVGYHGRASSIVVSGTDFIRPAGQIPNKETGIPSFGKTKELDIEVEMAFIVGKETQLGDTVDVNSAEDYIFGMVLFNDWSARDIQRWEYVPLGPFLGKNFASTISPWVITMEALEPFRTNGPVQDTPVLPYLQQKGNHSFDIPITASLITKEGIETVICETNFKFLYWTMVQQLAHHTVNGCNIRIGDLMASGTISGKEKSSFGSMLEISWKGTQPIQLNDGSTRSFLLDGDTIKLKARSEADGIVVGFGEATGTVLE